MNNSLFDDNGNIKYIVPNTLIEELSKSIINKYGFPFHKNTEILADLINLSAGIVQSYDVSISLNGLGGSGLENFYSQGNEIELAIKEILKDMLNKNIYYKYLPTIIIFDVYQMSIFYHYDVE